MLPAYDKSKRKKAYQQLPKDAYIIKIMGVRQETWPSGDEVLRVAFDIAEGEYAGFYQKQFDANTNEDKKWPVDAVYNLNVPNDNSQSYVWDNWNTFFADLEDSNNGFVFDGDVKKLKGKFIGGVFRIKQSEYNGSIYDHTELKYSRTVEQVRTGMYGKLPNDKLLDKTNKPSTAGAADGDNEWMKVPEGSEPELPF